MPWTNLPTNYADAQWTGDRKYTINLGSGGTYQNATITDTTEYSPTTPGGNYFYGANDANQTNDAINKIVAAQSGEVLYYNASGTTGTIDLGENVSINDYDYCEIYYKHGSTATFRITKIVPNYTNLWQLWFVRYSQDDGYMVFDAKHIVASGRYITDDYVGYGNFKDTEHVNVRYEDQLYITKVIGYKIAV